MQTNTDKKKRWVVKIGSALITAEAGLNLENIHQWSRQFAQLIQEGVELVLVSSGS